MNNDSATPYEHLTPDLILSAIENLGFQCDGRLQPLNSYENRVYQVGITDFTSLIAKFYRPDRWSDEAIVEEHEFANELMDYEIPVVAPWISEAKKTLHHYQGFRFALFPIFSGRALELDNMEQIEWMGRFIGRLHAISACRPFLHRQQLNIHTQGYASYQFLLEHDFIPDCLINHYRAIAESLLQHVEQQFQLCSPLKFIRLHGDIHAGNVLWSHTGTGPHIVDLDDCIMGPAIQDLWMLLSGDETQMTLQTERILQGYQQFHDFNLGELQLIESLRSLRMMHYAGWLARRWDDPTFSISFPWFNTPQYWQNHLNDLSIQLELVKKILM